MNQIDKSIKGWLKKVTLHPTKRVVQPQQINDQVFGVSLNASILYANATISYRDKTTSPDPQLGFIPIVVSRCGAFLKQNALDTVGIFRLSGSSRRTQILQEIFNTSSSDYGAHFDWSGYTVHDAATLLRRYLNHLPDSVITQNYYQDFCDVMNNTSYSTIQERIDAFQSLIYKLPLAHQHVLLYLLDMLSLFAQKADVHLMNSYNLAAIFCPAILSHPSQTTPTSYIVSQKVIEFLIEFHSLFAMQTLNRRPSNVTYPPAFTNVIAFPMDQKTSTLQPLVRRKFPFSNGTVHQSTYSSTGCKERQSDDHCSSVIYSDPSVISTRTRSKSIYEFNTLRHTFTNKFNSISNYHYRSSYNNHHRNNHNHTHTHSRSHSHNHTHTHSHSHSHSPNECHTLSKIDNKTFIIHDTPVTPLPPTMFHVDTKVSNRSTSLNKETIQLCNIIGYGMCK